MPPPKSDKKLTAAQKELLRRWIAAGAEYQPHWSFIAPVRPEPASRQEHGLGPQSHRQRSCSPNWKQRGLRPAAEADRRTLAPPRQPRPDRPAAAARGRRGVCQRQLRRRLREICRPAADVAALGRTSRPATGSTPPATPTPTASTSTISARSGPIAIGSSAPSTATCRSTGSPSSSWPATCCPIRPSTSSSPPASIAATSPPTKAARSPRRYLVLYTRDRTETVAQVWLGLTANCAVCHDHKFDSFSMQRLLLDVGFLQQHHGQGDGRATSPTRPPIVVVPRHEDRQRWDALAKDLGAIRGHIAEREQDRPP